MEKKESQDYVDNSCLKGYSNWMKEEQRKEDEKKEIKNLRFELEELKIRVSRIEAENE